MFSEYTRAAAVSVAFLCSASVACTTSSSSPTTPTVVSVAVLTMEQDTNTPIGQAAWLTYASRAQEPGKIAVAVSASNIVNQLSPAIAGISTVTGRLKWDPALLEVDAVGAGDMMGGNAGAEVGHQADVAREAGKFAFGVRRNDGVRVQGTGELFIIRLKPVTGVTTGRTRIDLEPFLANEGGFNPFMTQLLLSPYLPTIGNQLQNAYGATITIRPGG